MKEVKRRFSNDTCFFERKPLGGCWLGWDGSADLMGSEVRPCMYTVNGFKLMMIEDGEVDPALAIAPPASEGNEEKKAKVHERMPTLFC